MWKLARYVLYLAILIGVFSFTYSNREYYYLPFIQKNVDKLSNSTVKIGSFALEFPSSLIVYGISYNNKLFIDRATLRFEPVKFIQNIKTPLKSLVNINIHKIVFADDNPPLIEKNISENSQQKTDKSSLHKLFSLFNLSCDIDKVYALYKGRVIKASDISLVLNKELDIGAKLNFRHHDIKTKGNISLNENYMTGNFYTEFDGFVNIKCDSTGYYNFNNKNNVDF